MQNVAYYGTHHITSHYITSGGCTNVDSGTHCTSRNHSSLARLAFEDPEQKNVAATSGVQDKFASSQHVSFLGTYLNMICQMNSN